MPSNDKFYPSISTILPLSALPDSLKDFETAIENALSDLYYFDLQKHSSPSGDRHFYRLNVFSYNEIGIEIPGTDFAIVLNPELLPGTGLTSSFPVSLSFELDILRYLSLEG